MANRAYTVLGIETSCDDTAVAIIRAVPGQPAHICANEIWSQHDDHRAFGGVVPEIAARSHVERLDGLVARAMSTAHLSFNDLDAIAVTAGPGLIGGVVVGLTTAKAISIAHDLPLIPVNHLEGHALSARLTEQVAFPYLLLLVSGGHTQLIDVRAVGDYRRLGTTIDDAAGEAFDKTAKLLGLGQPGGPKVEAAARNGNPDRFDFPEPLKQRAGCDFSFSGLKTAVRLAALRLVDKDADHQPGNEDIADLAASFQFAAARHLAERTQKAMRTINEHYRNVDKDTGPRLVVAGGVAANSAIKGHLNDLCQAEGWRLMAPPAKYCTDNGAMIAQAGLERLGAANTASMYTHHGDPLAMAPRARWPLATVPAGAPAYGGGKKGPKA